MALYVSGWWPLKQQGIGGGHKYGDLSAVVGSAHCYQSIGMKVYSIAGVCQYQYGHILLATLNFFHINQSNVRFIGLLFFTLSSLVLAVCTFHFITDLKSCLVAVALIISTGSWLLFERGNFDSLILILLTLSAILSTRKYQLISIVLVSITVLFKFYTFPLLVFLFFISKSRLNKWLVVLSSLVILPIVWSDFSATPSYPNPLFAAFGISSPGLWINFFAWRFKVPLILNSLETYIIGAMFIFIGFIVFEKFLQLKRFSLPQVSVDRNSHLNMRVFTFSSLVFISCFLAGMNFDYRLIFLSIALISFNYLYPEILKSKTLIFIQLSALWFTYFFFGATGPAPVLLALLGNICQYFLVILLLRVLASEYLIGKWILATRPKMRFFQMEK
jgi:hypothetical protein